MARPMDGQNVFSFYLFYVFPLNRKRKSGQADQKMNNAKRGMQRMSGPCYNVTKMELQENAMHVWWRDEGM